LKKKKNDEEISKNELNPLKFQFITENDNNFKTIDLKLQLLNSERSNPFMNSSTLRRTIDSNRDDSVLINTAREFNNEDIKKNSFANN